MSEGRCLYCLRPFSEGGGATDEHIFGDAFGGRAVIDACAECNQGFGRTIEGDIHARDSVLDVIKLAAGEGSLRGKAQLSGDAEAVDVVLGSDGRPALEHPVVRMEKEGDQLNGRLLFPEGTPSEQMVAAIETRLLREGMQAERARQEAEQAVAQAKLHSEPVEVRASLDANLELLRRHAAKVALAAATRADVAIDTDFSASLRERATSTDIAGETGLMPDRVDEIRDAVRVAGLSPPSLDSGHPAAQVTFVALPDGTFVDVHLLGQPHPAGPILVPAEIPALQHGDVQVVRETSEQLEVVSSR